MKTFNFKSIISFFILCFFTAFSAKAQQFVMRTLPAAQYSLLNINDLRNTGAAANLRPAGLVTVQPLGDAQNQGTCIHHYNTADGAVINPFFNYGIVPNNITRNLRGQKFAEGIGSYFIAGQVAVVTPEGGYEDQIFLIRVNAVNGSIQKSRYFKMPSVYKKLQVKNILLVNNTQLYVSGHVTSNELTSIFLMRTNADFSNITFLRTYSLDGRHLNTHEQCLINEGANGLYLGGTDMAKASAVTFKVDALSGNVLSSRCHSLCRPSSYIPIQSVSIGKVGNVPVMTTVSVYTGSTYFNVARMNSTWGSVSALTSQKTHRALNLTWMQRSVRYEPAGVVLGFYDVTNNKHIRARYNGTDGTLIPGSNIQYNPSSFDLNNINSRTAESISLPNNNRIFTVAIYRSVANLFGYMGLFQPSVGGCQSPVQATFEANERLISSCENVVASSIVASLLDLPTQVINISTVVAPICDPLALTPESETENRSAIEEIIENDGVKADIKVYPNPFQQSINVQSGHTKIAEILLLNAVGCQLHREQLSGTEVAATIELGPLSAGLYLLRIKDSDGNWHVRKMIKE